MADKEKSKKDKLDNKMNKMIEDMKKKILKNKQNEQRQKKPAAASGIVSGKRPLESASEKAEKAGKELDAMMNKLRHEARLANPPKKRTRRAVAAPKDSGKKFEKELRKLRAELKLKRSQSQQSKPSQLEPSTSQCIPETSSGDVTCEQDMFERNKLDEEMNQLMEYMTKVCKPTKRPTFIEASRSDWDLLREKITRLYPYGMVVADRQIGERQQISVPICMSCGSSMTYEGTDKHADLHILSITGMMTSCLEVAKCDMCSWSPLNSPVDFVRVGLWPIDLKSYTFVEFSYMLHNSVLQHFNPTLSLSSMLQTLKFVTGFIGTNKFEMKQDTFNYSMTEWREQENTFLSRNTSGNLFHCPACQHQPHTIHIDGNAKLYRYSSAGRATQVLENESEDITNFFVPRQKVSDTVANIMSSRKQLAARDCGGSVFKANRTKGRAHAKKSETGALLATCRHSFLLQALDMSRGEIYAYPYTLQKEFPGAKFIATDVMCRYWPWLQRIDKDLSEIQGSFLSVFHAKSHGHHCQISWSGRVTTGAALSTGETTELANSYMSRLGITTRHMTSDGRRKRLMHAAGFWNVRKMMELPRWIQNGIEKCQKTIPKLADELYVTAESIGMSYDEIKSAAVRNAARSQESDTRGLTGTEALIERLYSNIRRYNRSILKVADSGKSREQIRKKLRNAHHRLRQATEAYSRTHPEADISQIKDGKFPWNDEGVVSDDMEDTIEKMHLYERHKEELHLLLTERNSLLSFWVSQLKEYEKDPCRLSVFLTNQLQECQRYFGPLPDFSDAAD